MASNGSLFIVEAIVKKGDPVEPVRDEMIRIVEDFAANPPSPAEMERTRIRMANSYEQIMTNHETIGRALSEYIALGDWRTFFLQRDEMQKVTAGQVQAASRKYLLRGQPHGGPVPARGQRAAGRNPADAGRRRDGGQLPAESRGG